MNSVLSMAYMCSLIFLLYDEFDRKPQIIEFILTIFIGVMFNNIIFNYQFMIFENIMTLPFIIKTIIILIGNCIMMWVLNRNKDCSFIFSIITFHIFYLNVFSFFKYILQFLTSYFSYAFIFPLGIIILHCLIIGLLKGLKYNRIIPNKQMIQDHSLLLSFINITVLMIYLIVFYWFYQIGITNIYVQLVIKIPILLIWIWLLYGLKNIFVIHEKETEELYIKNIYQSIEQYKNQYEQDQEKMRKLKHDMKNHLLIIKKIKDSKEIQDYADNVYLQLENIDLNQDTISGNLYIDAIIHTKISEYPNVDINYHFYIVNCPIDMIKICPLIFNLIDNACQAAKDIDGFVYISMEYQEPHLLLNVKNSCQQKPQFTSNRGEGHGYGMKIVKDIVKTYSGDIHYEVLDQEVSVKVVLTI